MEIVEEGFSVALVYAEISGQFFAEVERRHPERVVNVGIREQLLVNVGAGLALTGMRPVVHTFGSFLVTPGRFHVVRRGRGATVVAVGPMLDPVLEATRDLDVTVLYAGVVRPFDAQGLRAVLARPDVVLVEPYLTGTSSRLVGDALRDVPHRLLALGVGTEELRRYGGPKDHLRAHGLDPQGLRASITGLLGGGEAAA